MALDIQQILREVVTHALDATEAGSSNGSQASDSNGGGSGGGLSGMKGIAAGAGAAALAPLAVKNAPKLLKALGIENVEELLKSPGEALGGAASNLGQTTSGLAGRVTGSGQEDDDAEERDDADDEDDGEDGGEGIGTKMKDAVTGIVPGLGDGGGSKNGAQGVGKGRRMPIQQSVDIGLPIETVYNQWTQFEDWPTFMHRVKRVTQEDDCTVSFAVKIWGKTKEFTAKIDTQRPDERIRWRVSQGMTHNGTVSFHEMGPNLTRVLLSFDVDPGSLVEKFARGARHVKRAARADLHRFKALIEMAEHETGAWRGVIEEGELVEEHDPDYDEEREYSDIDEITDQGDSDEPEDSEESEDSDESEDADEPEGSEDEDSDEESDQEEPEASESGDDDESGDSEAEEETPQPARRRRQNSRARSEGRSRSGSRSGGSRGSSDDQSGDEHRSRSRRGSGSRQRSRA